MGRKSKYRDYDPSTPIPNPKYEKLAQLASIGKLPQDAMREVNPEKGYNAVCARQAYNSTLASCPAILARIQFLKLDNERYIPQALTKKAIGELEKILDSDCKPEVKVKAAEALNRMRWLATPSGTTALPVKQSYYPSAAVQVNIGSPASPASQEAEDWLELIDKLNSPAQVVDCRTVSGGGILEAELVK